MLPRFNDGKDSASLRIKPIQYWYCEKRRLLEKSRIGHYAAARVHLHQPVLDGGEWTKEEDNVDDGTRHLEAALKYVRRLCILGGIRFC